MKKKQMLYEGKAKKIYETTDENKVIVQFKDDATAFNGEKQGQIVNKGQMNNAISNFFFKLLQEKGIPVHYLKSLSETEVLVRRLEIIPIEVVVRNIAAGSLARRLGLEEGTELKQTVLEFYYKDDELGDPLINEYHIFAQELCGHEDLEEIKKLALKINDILVEYLGQKNIDLVDFKLEFGKGTDGKIYLGDEISPDTCRFWDSKTKKKLDKDRFRQDLGEVEGAYQEILRRLTRNEVE